MCQPVSDFGYRLRRHLRQFRGFRVLSAKAVGEQRAGLAAQSVDMLVHLLRRYDGIRQHSLGEYLAGKGGDAPLAQALYP
ncbi:hypothetical protein SDC9_160503 [bioreactor metagenome]|uniref:Uncharacterized protein n=1 Tax=bioreactor metagenome TaxID=1076179 RepID=A0A645FLW3_9ZZZZ